MVPHLAEGQSKSGGPVSCTANYGTDCSEVNSLGVLGQVLTNLIMAASGQGTTTLPEVLQAISLQNYNYADYHISLFEISQTYCDIAGTDADEHLVGSGCCVAHGKNGQGWQYKTWQEILDSEHVSSILGSELHTRLTTKANAGGGWIKYSWNSGGTGKTKKAWVSPSTTVVELDNRQLEGYLVVEYFDDEPPPTCDTCVEDADLEFGDWHCADPQQEFCGQYDVRPLPDHIIYIICALVATVIFGGTFSYWYRQRRVAMIAKQTQEAADRQKKHELEKAEWQKKNELQIQAQKAEESMEEALVNQAKALELKKRQMEYPPTWKMELTQVKVRGGDRQVQVPEEGLFDVLPDSSEYWDFFEEHLKKLPDPRNVRGNSDRHGMHDAWITKLQRIQNSDLYTYYDSQKQRIAKTEGAKDPKTGKVKETKGWHGTGGFDAVNIYEDRQVRK